MEELKIKNRRGELTLTQKDVILFNGACYQLITQKYREGRFDYYYLLTTSICEKLIKQGKLIKINQTEKTDEKTSLHYYKITDK